MWDKRETVPNVTLSHEVCERGRLYLTLYCPRRWEKRDTVPNATLSQEDNYLTPHCPVRCGKSETVPNAIMSQEVGKEGDCT